MNPSAQLDRYADLAAQLRKTAGSPKFPEICPFLIRDQRGAKQELDPWGFEETKGLGRLLCVCVNVGST